jgi:hypothetical protein
MQAYVEGVTPEWLQPDKVTELFSSGAEYLKFVEDYEDQKAMLDSVKYELADS